MPEADKYIKFQIAEQTEKHIDHDICSMVFTKNQGVKGILCKTCNLFISMVFSKNKGWDEQKAQEFLKNFPSSIAEIQAVEDGTTNLRMHFKTQGGEEMAVQLTPTFKMVKEIEEQTLGKTFFKKDELKEVSVPVIEKKEDDTKDLQICKLDLAKRTVYGAFLVPEIPDHEGDVISHEDVEKVAHDFIIKYRAIDEMHNKNKLMDADIIESFIAWKDGLEYYGKVFPRGAWLGAVKIRDEKVWEKVQAGLYKGFSVRICGQREKINA